MVLLRICSRRRLLSHRRRGIPERLSVHFHPHLQRVDDKCRIQGTSGLRLRLRLRLPLKLDNRVQGIADCSPASVQEIHLPFLSAFRQPILCVWSDYPWIATSAR